MTSITTDTIREIYTDHFNQIYLRSSPELMSSIKAKVLPHRDEIASVFYQAMLEVKDSDGFLSEGLVKTQLQVSMSKWIEQIFVIREQQELASYVEYLLAIGQVHARINLPLHLFNCGVRVLKQEICRVLRKDGVSLKEYNQTSTLANMLIDLSTSLMNESYLGDIVVGERKAQSLQLHMTGSELALKCEQLRSETFSWHTKLLNILHDTDTLNNKSIPAISQSEVGLWITHKGMLFFPSSNAIQQIQESLILVDEHVEQLIKVSQSGDKSSINEIIDTIDNLVRSIVQSLSSLVEHSIAMDSGRDTLTKLFNRRYLDTVLQKETHFCMKTKKSYVLMLLDIDHFKNINDTYGHAAGDRVLEQIGELLSNEIRAGDFVFRYGGEEFLILLTDMKIEFIAGISDGLLNAIRKHEFKIGLDKPINCTVSIGVAAHQGRPDYNKVITNADKALYQAKENGRNQFAVFSE